MSAGFARNRTVNKINSPSPGAPSSLPRSVSSPAASSPRPSPAHCRRSSECDGAAWASHPSRDHVQRIRRVTVEIILCPRGASQMVRRIRTKRQRRYLYMRPRTQCFTSRKIRMSRSSSKARSSFTPVAGAAAPPALPPPPPPRGDAGGGVPSGTYMYVERQKPGRKRVRSVAFIATSVPTRSGTSSSDSLLREINEIYEGGRVKLSEGFAYEMSR